MQDFNWLSLLLHKRKNFRIKKEKFSRHLGRSGFTLFKRGLKKLKKFSKKQKYVRFWYGKRVIIKP